MGLSLFRNVAFQYCAMLWIFCTAAEDVSLKCTQFPESVAVKRGENVTLLATVSGLKKDEEINVFWGKVVDKKLITVTPDNRRKFEALQNGTVSFHLQNVTFHDSGVYKSRVQVGTSEFVDGNGTDLIVFLPPTPLQIFSSVLRTVSSTSLTLECKTAAFFPERLNITWFKNRSEIQSGMELNKKQNTAGLYEVSSYLHETVSLQSGTNYTCQISHVSLHTGARVYHVIHLSDTYHGFPLVFLYPCLGVGFLILLLVITILKLLKLHRLKDLQAIEDTTNEQLTYATLNFTEPKKHSNPKQMKKNNVHAEVLQMDAEERQTYCAVDFVGRKKGPKTKRHEENVVYGQVWQNYQNRVFELMDM